MLDLLEAPNAPNLVLAKPSPVVFDIATGGHDDALWESCPQSGIIDIAAMQARVTNLRLEKRPSRGRAADPTAHPCPASGQTISSNRCRNETLFVTTTQNRRPNT